MKTLTILLVIAPVLTLPAASPDQATEDIFSDLQTFEPSISSPQPSGEPAISPANSPAEPVLTMDVPSVAIQPQSAPVMYIPKPTDTPLPEEPAREPLSIAATLELGKETYADENWNEAQGLFEAVLARDPQNTDAIRWLKRIAAKKTGIETKSYHATRSQMLGEVQAAWNTPKSAGEQPMADAPAPEPTADELRMTAIREKLDNIRIPAVTFQDADIQQVVLELSALCRKLDPERKGINLVVFGTAETLLPPITFSGTDLSARETLDIITQMSGMKYDVGPGMVSLTPVNYEPPQQMVSTEFDIMPSVGGKMMLRAAGDETGLVDVRAFFGTVPFPPGSSAQYNPEFNILLVRNVPKHLDKVAALLTRYNEKAAEERARQVEIETKFIEVSQGALEELGFEWTLGTPGENISSESITLAGGQQLFTDTLRTGEEAFGSSVGSAGSASSFNSYAATLADPTGTGLIGTAGELIIKKVNGLEVQTIIHALERQAGSDLLSAPRVLAKSGETASIHVGEVHWFPTAYDVEIERYAQPSLVPLDYEEEKTGVMLEVTPELDPENGTINMRLAPEIRELAGFDQQHVGTIWPEFGDEALDLDAASTNSGLLDFLTAREENRTVNADRLIARRPVFKTRKVETTMTVEDGSTIAMGGLIKETLETFRDSVPILGKIPVIGRLFRSEGERSVKRNLLIFVTANQVDASGYKKSAE